MTKFFAFAAAALALSAPALAAQEDMHFTRDGQNYVATVTHKNGYDLITGRNTTTGESFTLRVAGGRVTGDFGGNQVAFAGSLPAAATAVAAAN